MRTSAAFILWLAIAQLNSAIAAINLLERYPTTLTEGDTTQVREWRFGAEDIFSISQFKFATGDQLRLDLGPSDVGLGHCSEGAVWAVVIPQTRSGLSSQVTNIIEPVAHVWLRFHPGELNSLFPPDTVTGLGSADLAPEMGVIAQTKIRNSWQGGGRALIPPPGTFTVDVDTWTGVRRFFAVENGAARYVPDFEGRIVKRPPPITRELAAESFDKLWSAFDECYAMFALRPEVNWSALRDQFRTRAIESKSTYALANLLAEMLRPLRDLHVWLTVAGANIPVFDRPRFANANPATLRTLLPRLQTAGRDIQWTVTDDKVGFVLIRGWNDRELPTQFDKLLEQLRDTRALIIDVRLNGGGSEPLAREVAGRFLTQEFTYAFSQYRAGANHTDLGPKQPRRASPRGPWRYDRPVILLIGQRSMSSNESFVAMMTGDPEVFTMGDHTAGSSGNPKIVQLPLAITVSVPQWIDYLPDGWPLDDRGVEPKIRFAPESDSFKGDRDDLLAAALDRARKLPLPITPIPGPIYLAEDELPHPLRTPSREVMNPMHDADATSDPKRPHVVAVFPADGAHAAACVTEIRIRFDRPMDPLSLSLGWLAGGYIESDLPKYNPTNYEFRLPVRLPPGASNIVVINDRNRPPEGFLSTNSTLAAPFTWSFRTMPILTPGKRPTATQIAPPPGSRVPNLQFIHVQFDQEMLPPSKFAPYVAPRKNDPFGPEVPGIIPLIEFDSNRRDFRIPMIFLSQGKQQFDLAGLCGANGLPCIPVKLEYEPSGGEIDIHEREQAEAAATDPKLLELLAAMKQKRSELSSVIERVQTIHQSQVDGIFTSLRSSGSEFRWQRPGHFYADVSQIMGLQNFRIGCDGRHWWWLLNNERHAEFVTCPTNEMHELNVSICDPFDLLHKNPKQVAADLRLKYSGLKETGEGKFHVIEAWQIRPSGLSKPWVQKTEWHIDPSSFGVASIAQFTESNIMRTRFLHESINRPIPAEAFAPPVGMAIEPSPPEPLDNDYTNRFVNLRDGSDGRMSVRWGKSGPKGRNSSGLN